MQINRLKDVTIHTLKEGMHCDGGGLWLQITTGTDGRLNHSWLFRYRSRATGKQRSKGLGALHTTTLGKARERARVCRNQLLDGIDPVDQKKAERAALKLETAKFITFDEAARRYIAGKEKGWSKATHISWMGTIRNQVSPVIGKLHVKDIDKALVLKVLEQPDPDCGGKLWETQNPTADTARSRIEIVLNYAEAMGWRPEGKNPASMDLLKHSLPAAASLHKTKHHSSLSCVHMPGYMTELRKKEDTRRLALEFAILTAVRVSEAIGAKWDEINMLDKTWNIPADRKKERREYIVPLSEAAIAVLNRAMELGRSTQNELIFPKPGGGKFHNPNVLYLANKILKDLKGKSVLKDDVQVTVHGFRTSFGQWGTDVAKIDGDMIDQCLAHTVGSAVSRAYQRSDVLERRRPVMEDWGQYCSVV